jgi:hypothetical protein
MIVLMNPPSPSGLRRACPDFQGRGAMADARRTSVRFPGDAGDARIAVAGDSRLRRFLNSALLSIGSRNSGPQSAPANGTGSAAFVMAGSTPHYFGRLQFHVSMIGPAT